MDVTDAQTAQQLGVSTMGVYVVEVTKGSGADAAGVQAGDRVLAVDDTAVSDSSAFEELPEGTRASATPSISRSSATARC